MSPDDADDATDPVDEDQALLVEPTFPPSVIATEEDDPPLDSDASRAKAGGQPEASDSGGGQVP